MESSNQLDLLDVVGLMYEAAADHAQWLKFLEAFGPTPDAMGVSKWLHSLNEDSATDDRTPTPCLGELHPSEVGSAGAHRPKTLFGSRNEESLPSAASKTSAPLHSNAVLKPAESNPDRFSLHELLQALGSLADKHDTLARKFKALLAAPAGTDTEKERALYRQLTHHLQKAFSLHCRLSKACLTGQAALTSLELLPTAVWLLGAEGELLFANPAADVIVRRGDVLALSSDGCLRTQLANEDKRLSRMIRQALQNGHLLGHTPSGNRVFFGPGGASLHVLVVSLGQSRKACGAMTAAVFATDPMTLPPSLKDNLQRLYELTSAEARLACALVAGETLKAYAEQNGISIETARTHLKRIMNKIGARRQSDLIRVIVAGPAFIVAPGDKSAD